MNDAQAKIGKGPLQSESYIDSDGMLSNDVAGYGDTIEVPDWILDKLKTTKHLPFEDELCSTDPAEFASFIVLCMCAVSIHLLFRMF